MQNKWILFWGILSTSFLLVFLSCNSSTYQRSASGKRITPHNPQTDSILPLITYTLDELGDFYGPPISGKSIYSYLDKRYLHFIDGKMVEDQKKDKAFKRLKKKELNLLK